MREYRLDFVAINAEYCRAGPYPVGQKWLEFSAKSGIRVWHAIDVQDADIGLRRAKRAEGRPKVLAHTNRGERVTN